TSRPSTCILCNSYISFYSKTPTPTATYTLSLHDALPIYAREGVVDREILELLLGPPNMPERKDHDTRDRDVGELVQHRDRQRVSDRKSTRLNSSHRTISYAVFCLKKKKKNNEWY